MTAVVQLVAALRPQLDVIDALEAAVGGAADLRSTAVWEAMIKLCLREIKRRSTAFSGNSAKASLTLLVHRKPRVRQPSIFISGAGH